MDSRKLQDRLYYGLGVAARRVGEATDAFRPNGPHHPLDKTNRFLRLSASFLPMGGVTHPNTYGMVLWHGLFDASYTKPGDYLQQDGRTFFIAAQQPLLPVICVQTNRIVSVCRPNFQTGAASNPYGGYTGQETSTLMANWPASVLAGGGGSQSAAGLPTDQTVSSLAILLPAQEGINLSPGDLVMDDLGRSAVISGSELSDLGWRITARLATT